MKNLKNIAVAVASLVVFTNITNAQTLKANYPVSYEEPLKVKYLGDEGQYLLFEVVLQAGASANPLFSIGDKKEGQFYSSVNEPNLKPRTFKIEKKDEDQVLNFNLVIGKKTYTKTFTVNKTTIEKINVAENDVTKL
jgi:hypothetical protein